VLLQVSGAAVCAIPTCSDPPPPTPPDNNLCLFLTPFAAAYVCCCICLLLPPVRCRPPVCCCRLDLRDIRVVCKAGGTIDDSELVAGCVFDQKVRRHSTGRVDQPQCMSGRGCIPVLHRQGAGIIAEVQALLWGWTLCFFTIDQGAG